MIFSYSIGDLTNFDLKYFSHQNLIRIYIFHIFVLSYQFP